jgi:hypothetical protein
MKTLVHIAENINQDAVILLISLVSLAMTIGSIFIS